MKTSNNVRGMKLKLASLMGRDQVDELTPLGPLPRPRTAPGVQTPYHCEGWDGDYFAKKGDTSPDFSKFSDRTATTPHSSFSSKSMNSQRHSSGSDRSPRSTKHDDNSWFTTPKVRTPRGPCYREDTFVYVAERKSSEPPRKEHLRIDDLSDSRESRRSSDPSRSISRNHSFTSGGPVELPGPSSEPSPKAEDFPKPPPLTIRRKYSVSAYPVSPYPAPATPLPKLPPGVRSSEAEDPSGQITKLNELIWLLLSDPGMNNALADKDKSTHAALLHTVVVLLATSPGTTDNARKEALKLCSLPSSRRRTELALGLATMTQN